MSALRVMEMTWIRSAVDRSGLAAFVHLIRHPDDPRRSPRPPGGHDERAPHRVLDAMQPEKLERQILDLLADGVPRTFNRMAVELWDVTADVVFETAADRALWRLIGPVLEHSLEAPVFFRVRPELLAEGVDIEGCLREVPGRQLGIDFAA